MKNKLLSIEELIKFAGPTKTWEGQCYAVACRAAPLVGGEAVYGHFYGEVSTEGYWSKRSTQPFYRHGWVVLPDGSILDPTRWSFENVAPYIWQGEAGQDYDLGGNRLRSLMRTPPPQPGGDYVKLNLSSECRQHLVLVLGTNLVISAAEMAWLASAPLVVLGEHAHGFFTALVDADLGGFIPLDNRRHVLGRSKET